MPTISQIYPREDEPLDDWGDDDAAPEPSAPTQPPQAARHTPSKPRLAHPAPALQPAPTAEDAETGEPMPRRAKTGHYPALACRSSLFGIGAATPNAPDLVHVALAAPASYGLKYSGPRLTLHDKAVWEAAIDLAKPTGRGVGAGAAIPLRAIAEHMGLSSRGGPALASIHARLLRLERARVSFTTHAGVRASGPLLASVAIIGQTATVEFDPGIAQDLLGGGEDQFLVNAARRRTLGSSLAQWLHDYASTHKAIPTLDLRHLRGLCGYGGEKRHFPKALSLALGEVAAAAPTLLKSHAINRNGQDSDMWTVDMSKGDENPVFLPAARKRSSISATAATGGPPQANAKQGKKRSGGVVL